MSLLTEALPSTVNVCGKECKIKTDFRAWLNFSHILQHESDQTEKIIRMLSAVYIDCPDDLTAGIEAALAFYFPQQNEPASGKPPVYDFDFDGDYIVAAFRQQYSIDLTDIEMHWHKFRALFNSLSEGTQFSEIMRIRSVNPSEIKDSTQRAKIRKAQHKLRIPDMRTEEEKENDFAKNFCDAFI